MNKRLVQIRAVEGQMNVLVKEFLIDDTSVERERLVETYRWDEEYEITSFLKFEEDFFHTNGYPFNLDVVIYDKDEIMEEVIHKVTERIKEIENIFSEGETK